MNLHRGSSLLLPPAPCGSAARHSSPPRQPALYFLPSSLSVSFFKLLRPCCSSALSHSPKPLWSKVAPAHLSLLFLLLLCLGPLLGPPTLLGSSAAIPCPDTRGFCSPRLQMPRIPQHGHIASFYQGEAPLLHQLSQTAYRCPPQAGAPRSTHSVEALSSSSSHNPHQ